MNVSKSPCHVIISGTATCQCHFRDINSVRGTLRLLFLFQVAVMGSRLSRPSDSSPISSTPHLPFDIYLEVLSHLGASSAEDRKTLLALSLCCRTLRDASQKILFSNIRCDHPGPATNPDNLTRTLKFHSKFLRAIVESPDRLAPYVVSYSQHALGLDPKLRPTGANSV